MKYIVTLTGPSGSGKTTLANELTTGHGFKNIVSHTTRSPRTGEVDGQDYYFVTEQQFDHMVSKSEFIECVIFNGVSYGVSTLEIEKAHCNDSVPVLVVEPHGLLQIDTYCKTHGITLVSVYVNGPIQTLVERILTREFLGRPTAAVNIDYVAKRIISVQEERDTWWRKFDYSLVFMYYNESNKCAVPVSVARTIENLKSMDNIRTIVSPPIVSLKPSKEQ